MSAITLKFTFESKTYSFKLDKTYPVQNLMPRRQRTYIERQWKIRTLYPW